MLMQLRNEDVKKKAKKSYNNLVPDDYSLPVFCVSNAEYTKLKYAETRGALQADVTGIPVLRAFALSRVAPTIQQHLERRLEAAVPSFIETVDLWCRKEPVANAAQILAKIREPQSVSQGHQMTPR